MTDIRKELGSDLDEAIQLYALAIHAIAKAKNLEYDRIVVEFTLHKDGRWGNLITEGKADQTLYHGDVKEK